MDFINLNVELTWNVKPVDSPIPYFVSQIMSYKTVNMA